MASLLPLLQAAMTRASSTGPIPTPTPVPNGQQVSSTPPVSGQPINLNISIRVDGDLLFNSKKFRVKRRYYDDCHNNTTSTEYGPSNPTFNTSTLNSQSASYPTVAPTKQPRAQEQKSVRPTSRDDRDVDLDEDENDDEEKYLGLQFRHDHTHCDFFAADYTYPSGSKIHPSSGRILEEGELVLNPHFDSSCKCPSYLANAPAPAPAPWSTEEEFEQAVQDRVQQAVEQEAKYHKAQVAGAEKLGYDQGFSEGQTYQASTSEQPYSQLLASPVIVAAATMPSGMTEEQRRLVAQAVLSIEKKIAATQLIDLTDSKRNQSPVAPVQFPAPIVADVKVGDRCRIYYHLGHRTKLDTMHLLNSGCITSVAKVVALCDGRSESFGPDSAGMIVMEFEDEDLGEEGYYTIIRPEHIVDNYGQ